MAGRRVEGARGNALRRGRVLRLRVEAASSASPDAVWVVLADIRTHLEWAGTMQGAGTRLESIDAEAGPAHVGSEFASTGRDPMGTFTDTSVVTEAIPGQVLEFVTEARLETRRGAAVAWTIVHRYELAPHGTGCLIAYAMQITRISSMPGALVVLRLPVLSTIAMRMSATVARRGLANLIRFAERHGDQSRS